LRIFQSCQEAGPERRIRNICPRCEEHKVNPHNCPCKLFLCWYDGTQDIPEEAVRIYAYYEEGAAEKMARRWFNEEFEAKTMTVWVQPYDGEERQPWIVEAQTEVNFYARAGNQEQPYA
jgi:hypothetical protein